MPSPNNTLGSLDSNAVSPSVSKGKTPIDLEDLLQLKKIESKNSLNESK